MVKQRGGVSRMMLLCLPVMATSTCRVFIPNMISEASSALATCLLPVISRHYYHHYRHLALLVLHNLETLDEAAAAHVADTREPACGDIEAAQETAGSGSPVPQVEEGPPQLLSDHVRRAHHLLTFDHLQNLHS